MTPVLPAFAQHDTPRKEDQEPFYRTGSGSAHGRGDRPYTPDCRQIRYVPQRGKLDTAGFVHAAALDDKRRTTGQRGHYLPGPGLPVEIDGRVDRDPLVFPRQSNSQSGHEHLYGIQDRH